MFCKVNLDMLGSWPCVLHCDDELKQTSKDALLSEKVWAYSFDN